MEKNSTGIEDRLIEISCLIWWKSTNVVSIVGFSGSVLNYGQVVSSFQLLCKLCRKYVIE